MKFIKFLSKIGFAATTSFGLAALITGFISVFKVLIRFNSINSFSEVMDFNHSTFDVYTLPFSVSIFFLLLVTYYIFTILGKKDLLDKQMPF